jgi:serine kinase of HPr protein (carbohydrate metabolism regulator)
MEERKKFLKRLLRERLHKVVDDPKVRRLLTEKEAVNGLETVIERIVEDVLEREKQLGRKLTFAEFKESVMKTLNELAPSTNYII